MNLPNPDVDAELIFLALAVERVADRDLSCEKRRVELFSALRQALAQVERRRQHVAALTRKHARERERERDARRVLRFPPPAAARERLQRRRQGAT